jgi:hypothetical protein
LARKLSADIAEVTGIGKFGTVVAIVLVEWQTDATY